MPSHMPRRLKIAQILCRPLPPILAGRIRKLVYPLWHAQRDEYPFTLQATTRSLFSGRTSDYYAYHFSVHGYFEWRNWAVALALCVPGDTIIEIGANIGTETIGFADIVGKSGRVYAIEPLPANQTAIEHNRILNQHEQTRILKVALGDRCQQVQFTIPRAGNSGLGHIVMPHTSTSNAVLDVEMVTLDSLYENGEINEAVRIIFMDVEGAEVLALRGMKAVLAAYRPTLVVEAAPIRLQQTGFTLAELYAQVIELNYQPFQIAALGIKNIASNALPDAECNWLCLHQSHLEDVNRVKQYLTRCGFMPCMAGLNPLIGGKHYAFSRW